MRSIFAFLILAFATVGAFAAGGEREHVTGTASYRERIALPPGAVFEAILEDVSVADASATEVGRTSIADPGGPPFAFSIDFDRAAIDPSRTYSVRAQVAVGRRLIFVSDTMNPVLTGGAGEDVQVQMIKVGDTAEEGREAPVQIGAHGLRLPASFTGELPCKECDEVRYQVDLWPDQVFQLRRTWVGKKDMRRDSIGRWSVDAKRHVLVLGGGDEELQFEILGPDQLRLLDRTGAAIGSDDEYQLTASAEFRPFEPHLPMRGMLTYVADQARFTECLSGRDYPLVHDGDYEALEHAYLAAGAEPDGPIMASFDGGIVQEPDKSGTGTVPMVLVERFVGVWPDETCDRATDAASLTNTYWKILRLGETDVAAGEGRREPNLILRQGASRFTATVGCNQITGSYTLQDDKLSFSPPAATMMACQEPLDKWERQLATVLAATAGWRIDGQTLELLDPSGEPLALFQAVYLY